MDYAITLYFDDATENNFSRIMEAVAAGGGNRYMVDTGIPPHITLALFSAARVDGVRDELERRHGEIGTGEVIWASLGAFVPRVLYAAPVLSEYLRAACVAANELAEPFAERMDGYYLPGQWVPHMALAVQLAPGELNAAFAAAAGLFTAVCGRAERLALAECNPYREIAVWNLRA